MKLIFLFLVACTRVWAADSAETKRLQILGKLHAQRYFQYAKCAEVANGMLHKIGLPALGKAAPVNGKRGKFTRPAKESDPPVFKDEITGADGIKVAIQTKILNSTPPVTWQLHLTRSGNVKLKDKTADVSLDTDFTFEMVPKMSHKTCELTSIAFKVKHTPSDQSLRPDQVTIRECIDLFLTTAENVSTELKWIKSDCAIALHYSAEAKKLAATAPK